MSITPMIAAAATKATCCSVTENEKAEFPTLVVVDSVFTGGGAWGTEVVVVCVKDVDCPLFEEVEVAVEGCDVNKASSESGPLTTIEAGLFAPEYEPLPVPLQSAKSESELEEAESVSDCELLYHPDALDRFPESEGLMLRVT